MRELEKAQKHKNHIEENNWFSIPASRVNILGDDVLKVLPKLSSHTIITPQYIEMSIDVERYMHLILDEEK